MTHITTFSQLRWPPEDDSEGGDMGRRLAFIELLLEPKKYLVHCLQNLDCVSEAIIVSEANICICPLVVPTIIPDYHKFIVVIIFTKNGRDRRTETNMYLMPIPDQLRHPSQPPVPSSYLRQSWKVSLSTLGAL